MFGSVRCSDLAPRQAREPSSVAVQPARVSVYGSGALTQNLPPGYPTPHSALIFNINNLPPSTTGHLIWSLAKKQNCTPASCLLLH